MVTIPARTPMSLSGAGPREKVARHAVFKPLCFGTSQGLRGFRSRQHRGLPNLKHPTLAIDNPGLSAPYRRPSESP